MLTPEPELSPELEWILSSTQDNRQIFLEAAIQEYGTLLLRLAYILLDDLEQARQCLHTGLATAYNHRHRYRSTIGVRSWLLRQVYAACMSKLPALRLQRAWRALSPAVNYRSQITTDLPTSMQEANLWLAVDKLPQRLRSTYLLYTVLELPIDEISIIMQSSHHNGNRFLWKSLERLTKTGTQQINTARSLQNRWPVQPVIETNEKIQHHTSAASLSRPVGKTLNAFLYISLVLSIAWLGGYLNKIAPDGAPVQTVIHTLVVTQKVRVTKMVSPTPTVSITLPPMHAHTSLYDIQQRIASAKHAGWHTLFLDTIYYNYGPAGYLGPPQGYHSQIWYQKLDPGQVRVNILGGETGSAPKYAALLEKGMVYEIDLEHGLSSTYPENQNEANEHLPLEYLREQNKLAGLRDGSFLIHNLFAVDLDGNYDHVTVIGEEELLNRPVILLEYRSQNRPRQLFWVDAEHGIVLRWQLFDLDSPGVVVEELYPLSIAWNESFPDAALSRTFYWKQKIGWESTAVPEHKPAPTPSWQNIRDSVDATTSKPENYDPGESYISFHWIEVPDTAGKLSTTLQIRADNFLLGNLSISNPFDLVCERSPDGNKLAYVQPPPGPDGILFSPSAPSWIDLTRSRLKSHSALPNAVFSSSDFEFSPDSTLLAFWGCGAKEDNCGVYIHNLKTLKNTRLLGLQSGAMYFKWSPDGQWLALVGAGPNLKNDSSLLVLRVANGRIVYEEPFLWPGSHLPPDAPSWLGEYPPKRTRMDDCLGWPKQ